MLLIVMYDIKSIEANFESQKIKIYSERLFSIVWVIKDYILLIFWIYFFSIREKPRSVLGRNV